MRIRDLISVESIQINGTAKNKQDALNQMVDLMVKSGKITDVNMYRKQVFEREALGTTGIGSGIAIPHCKSRIISRPGLAAMIVRHGVEFETLDEELVYLIFLIAVPENEGNVQSEIFSKLSILLMDEAFKDALLQAKGTMEFLHLLSAVESY